MSQNFMGVSVPYRSETIATTINRLNVQYFLPAIQREFVWKPIQILQLFDSILRGYPISSFLFWELKLENRDKWETYRFIDAANQSGTHNQIVATDGVQQVTLVLDGQQRLTSLLIGLKGYYKIKKKYMKWDNPEAWKQHRLYCDLFKNPADEPEAFESNNEGLYYGLNFRENEGNTNHNNNSYWFRLGKILDFDSEDEFVDFLERTEETLPDDTTRKQIKIFRKNLNRLYKAIWHDDVISFYTEFDQNYDRVLDIFVRANEGGTKLSKSDLLLSMITSKWNDINAREEIYDFLDRINNDLTRKNNFDKDFIMKTCLVLTDLPVAYKVNNFNNRNLTLIRDNWEGIKSAIERCIDLVNSFGIDRDNLTSANTLIPIAYFLFHNQKTTLRGTTPFEAKNALVIRNWLAMSLLNGVLGGASDNMLRDIRKAIQEKLDLESGFPVDNINEYIRKAGKSADFDEYALDDILSLKYGQQSSFLALSLLYDDFNWGSLTYHKDHIFPKDMFNKNELELQGRSYWFEAKDRLANLSLLWSKENQEKGAQPLEDWLSTRTEDFKRRHLIPNDPNLWRFDKFDEFLTARENLIRNKLNSFFKNTIDEMLLLEEPKSLFINVHAPQNTKLIKAVDHQTMASNSICSKNVSPLHAKEKTSNSSISYLSKKNEIIQGHDSPEKGEALFSKIKSEPLSIFLVNLLSLISVKSSLNKAVASEFKYWLNAEGRCNLYVRPSARQITIHIVKYPPDELIEMLSNKQLSFNVLPDSGNPKDQFKSKLIIDALWIESNRDRIVDVLEFFNNLLDEIKY